MTTDWPRTSEAERPRCLTVPDAPSAWCRCSLMTDDHNTKWVVIHTQPLPTPLQPSGPSVSLYLTLFGVVAGLFSTFWAFGYVRLNRKLRAYLAAGPGADVPRIRKVRRQVSRCSPACGRKYVSVRHCGWYAHCSRFSCTYSSEAMCDKRPKKIFTGTLQLAVDSHNAPLEHHTFPCRDRLVMGGQQLE